MKNHLTYLHISISIFCILVFTPAVVSAQTLAPFIKYQDNPVPFHPDFSGRVKTGTYQPSVVYENGLFKLWYASLAADGFKLAYADSTDGINWKNYKVSTESDVASHNPSILHVNNIYQLYYTSDTGGLIVTKITDATSTRTVMVPEQAWEANGIFAPHVSVKDGIYTMFYTGWGNLGFRLGMATSADGETWNKCNNNPILPFTADGAHLFERDGISFLFFHSESGIEYMSVSGSPTCETVWGSRTLALGKGPLDYDNAHMISPSLVEANNNIYLYYSGLGSGGWTLNVATTSPISSSPPPTVTREPVVIIPGIFASWNKEAILHNAVVTDDDWILSPFVHEYDGIIKTLQNNGYIIDHDLYIYTYDWRKPVKETAEKLNVYISKVNASHPNRPVRLIAHSLGGLVARTALQQYQPHFHGTLTTVGTPHKGTANAYKAIEGGDIETQNSYEWLAQKLILQLHRNTALTDRELIEIHIPVVKDLMPIYPFIKMVNSSYIVPSAMKIRNSFLSSLNSALPLHPAITTVASASYQTLFGYVVTQRTPLDAILNLYPDGRPVNNVTVQGDGLVPFTSASLTNSTHEFTGNHGDIVSKKEAIVSLLENSHITVPATSIVEGTSSSVFPSLVFMVLSPATLQVKTANNVYSEHNGLILIPEPAKGTYSITATGNASGTYTLLVGAMNNGNAVWKSVIAKTSPSQTDVYTYNYDPANLGSIQLTPKDLLPQLTALNSSLNSFFNSHKRKIKVDQNTNPKTLISFLLINQKPTKVLELIPYLEQIEQIYGSKASHVNRQECSSDLKRIRTSITIMEKEIIRSHEAKTKALLLIWMRKRIELIEVLLTQQPKVAELMLYTIKEVMNTMR